MTPMFVAFAVLLFSICRGTHGFLTITQKPGINYQGVIRLPVQVLELKLAAHDDNDDERCNVNAEGIHRGMSRRQLLYASTVPLALLAYPGWAGAASHFIMKEEADNLVQKAQRKLLRPKPIPTLRPTLNKDFASLFTRASYQALDDLDCVPMDQFQKDFSVIWDAEYEQYAKDLVSVGLFAGDDLTDPYHFDFLSYAQYAAINREMVVDAPLVFSERKPLITSVADIIGGGGTHAQEVQYGPPTIVKRDGSLTNDQLLLSHSHRVASAILDHMESSYGGTKDALPSLPLNTRPGSATLLTSLSQLVSLFLLNGYALGGSVSIGKEGTSFGDAAGTKFIFSLTSPATLWSGQALQLLGKTGTHQLHNDFLLKAAKEMVARYGYHFTAQSMSYDGAQSTTSFTIG